MPHYFNSRSGRRQARLPSRGISLVEMVAVMSASSVLVGAAVVALVAIGRADRASDQRLNQQHALAQITERLRADIHAAQRATWDEPQGTLRLTAADGSVITYVAEEARWVRRALAPGDDTEGELTGAFRLPAGVRVKIEPPEATPGQRVRIEWSLPADDASRDAPSPVAEMIATVGRDERLLHE